MNSIDERLKKHLKLKTRIEAILDIADNTEGDCIKADDVEEKVIEEMRKLGQEVLQDWANEQNSKQTLAALDKTAGSRPCKKKRSIGTQHMEESKFKKL